MLTTPTNELVVLSESDQIWRNELIKEVARETRQPIQRVVMLTWAQFEAPNKIHTRTGREVELKTITATALLRLPHTGRYIFTMSPFPPIIPDEYLDGAREYIREQEALPATIEPKRRLRLTFC